VTGGLRASAGYHGRVSKPRDAQPSEAAQGYLLTLRSMTSMGGTAMTAALGRRMGVTVQAASEMVSRLAADGLVRLHDDRSITLSREGRVVADTIFRRHALLEWLLTRVVGLGWAESDEEAARLQGSVSPRVEAAIDALLGHPRTCPHGNPIDADAARERPSGIALAEVQPGTTVTILRITEEAEEDGELLLYLEEQGLVPGVPATVLEVSASRDSVAFDGPRGRGTMGLRPAALIRVLPGEADPALFHRVPDPVEHLHADRGRLEVSTPRR
jgi:DtxR family transcriptional regulator, Mn-dependent transcriptional regulator